MPNMWARHGGVWVESGQSGGIRVAGTWVPYAPPSSGELVNTCPNPAAKVDATGYGGSSTPVRETGITGMLRTTGIRITADGFVTTPIGPAGPNEEWTLSFYQKNESASFIFGRDVYFVSKLSGGGDNYQQLADTPALAIGAVDRGVITATSHADAVGVYLLLDLGSPGIDNLFTAFQYELGGSATVYEDEDS